MSEVSQPQVEKSKNTRRKALGIFFFILILISFLSGLYWFFFVKTYQTTEDAYVSGNQVMISAQIAGNVRQINAENMDFVHAGDVLLELDDADYQLSFSQAQNTLASAVRQISQLGYTVKQLEATVQANQIALNKAQGDLARREILGKSGAIDKESLQHAREAVITAKANLKAVKNQLAANQSLLLNVPLKEQPEIQKAISSLKQAWLNLQRTKIVSPVDGYVARRSTQIGQKVAVGSTLMAVIASDQMWVDANFKETQLKDMRIGQPVKLSFDLYGHDVKFDGKVEGIEMGTGSAFSLLPAQNATGNWIKVVQRVPVRISLDAQQLARYPLRIGLSTLVEVNIADTSGEILSQKKRTTPLYSTNTLDYDQSAVKNLIEKIISDNTN
ncbi:EmrA/EmrK family multidrug efflux transporter periplasmic adaptor subunit [Aggregatibacter actinomycetemcomitans]|uniref:EmrA/EmrK family multidrug efflux transporter periplasmic adaptor subunit n=1 Tax=Aggregatibacter actinomycetemcomitans TaxID=714 RepID=UPI0011D9BF79|nr:EmrA/EmrK family multidrug efflux transporter periplasmic adaptor subunit [Aggregatibacter actinomycetemcomitans]QEH45280.1 EmrA/EmrK family multidrug efflux transporter periplasmic adaptor subunit [Aggregatibacter actinomycetemcomitans]QEH49798.1 EmrA/EmrK family multidrug efflux transporter periplasmic adaptor subunit [Aggregatibacter actinomycetemcomitans]TYA50139.1 EmrA/EmrK family multidrug efflux transporter periplasmic adaptor subunit [Aggregatibacter actinomycetemcomitans]TYA50989.1 